MQLYKSKLEVGYIMFLRMPPKIKVLEGAAAVADGRITVVSDNKAEVKSSDGSRSYIVYVDLKSKEACSTDNGTIHRRYIGYPIISFLMLKGILPYNDRIAKALSGINWRELNEKYKNYNLVEEEVKKIAMSKGIFPNEIDTFKERVYSALKSLRFRYVPDRCTA